MLVILVLAEFTLWTCFSTYEQGGAFKIAEHKAAFKTHPVQLEAVNALDESTKDKPADRMRTGVLRTLPSSGALIP